MAFKQFHNGVGGKGQGHKANIYRSYRRAEQRLLQHHEKDDENDFTLSKNMKCRKNKGEKGKLLLNKTDKKQFSCTQYHVIQNIQCKLHFLILMFDSYIQTRILEIL